MIFSRHNTWITTRKPVPIQQDWLQELDHGPLGQDGHQFAQHANALLNNGYIRIYQLADEGLTVAEMLTHCPGLLEGTAIPQVTFRAPAELRIQHAASCGPLAWLSSIRSPRFIISAYLFIPHS